MCTSVAEACLHVTALGGMPNAAMFVRSLTMQAPAHAFASVRLVPSFSPSCIVSVRLFVCVYIDLTLL